MTAPTKEKPKTDSLHGPNLILDVENFGPIAEAKNIEFKPMTVFVGPSNTGKTYLAMLLHSVLQANPEKYGGFEWFIGGRDRVLIEPFRGELAAFWSEVIPITFTTVQDLIAPPRIPLSDLSEKSQNLVSRAAALFVSHYSTKAIDAVKEFFEVQDLFHLTTSGLLAGHVTYELLESVSHSSIAFPLTSQRFTFHDTMVNVPDSLRDAFATLDNDNAIERFRMQLDNFFASFVISACGNFTNSFYFPAGRAGIVNAHRLLATSVIDNSGRFGIEPAIRVTYHRLARDFLRQLIGIGPNPVRQKLVIEHWSGIQNDTEDFLRSIEILENSLIPGRVNVVDAPGLPEHSYELEGHEIPLFRSSSMVTELAPIVLFLRSLVKQGDLLIIDEPEAHLHPEAQQQMAAALAFMVRSGLRVLITTHSHYMVEQLSAFVNASKLDETTRKRALSLGGALGEEDIYLDEEEAAVYGFDQPNEDGGTVVYEIPLGEHREFAPRDHSKAVNRQYNRLQRVLEARERLGV